MPYVRKDKCVYRKDTGKKVGCSDTTAKAKKYLNKLRMVQASENVSFNDAVNSLLNEYDGGTESKYSKKAHEFLEGIFVEAEHVGEETKSKLSDINKTDLLHIVNTVLDHLNEDSEYYNKLKEAGL